MVSLIEWTVRASVIIAAVFVFVAPVLAQTAVDRGRYLVEGIAACGNCHTMKGPGAVGKEYAGGFVIEEGPFRAVSSNITPDRETGIGAWTDQQIIDAIRIGTRPDGSIIGPPMPIELYNLMADDDVRAIVAYLRTLKPVQFKPEKSVYRIPLHAMPYVQNRRAPSKSNKVAYGGYLAGPLGHCIECHTPPLQGGRDYANRFAAGGFEMPAPFGGRVVSANITPDRETGIGTWTDAQIKRAITEGVRPDGGKLVPLMPFDHYKRVSAEDLEALFAYLRSLKPIRNKVR